MSLSRLVDAVDDWLLEHVHGAFGPSTGPPPARPAADPLGTREHRRAREEVRRAAAGLLFLRNKLEAEQTERRVKMARACHAILQAAREDDDATALPLIAYRDTLRERIAAAEEELAGLRTQAADALSALGRLSRAVERIEHEQRQRRRRAPRRRAAGLR